MKMEIVTDWKKQNETCKTICLNGVLFLINDSCDELGLHYQDHIMFSLERLRFIMESRKLLPVPYHFVIIPDKSVLMSHLITQGNSLTCQRRSADMLRRLNLGIDTYDDVMALCQRYNFSPCSPKDSHPNLLSQYAVYSRVASLFRFQPIPVEITIEHAAQDDLAHPSNNKGRDLIAMQDWPLPMIRPKQRPVLINYQIVPHIGKIFHMNPMEVISHIRSLCLDYYRNNDAPNKQRVLIFHDSNLAYNTENRFIVKEWYASHFRETYFVWSSLDENLIALIPGGLPDVILDISMERFLNDYRDLMRIFDGDYYLQKYPDVKRAIDDKMIKDARTHYITQGFREGRLPNGHFEVEVQYNASIDVLSNSVEIDWNGYGKKYRLVMSFIQEFPIFTAKDFYHIYGYLLGHILRETPPKRSFSLHSNDITLRIAANIDVEWYRNTYGQFLLYPYYHYIQYGAINRLSPNAWFDENYYRTAHPDVDKAIQEGIVKSGFVHYCFIGYTEGRVYRPDSQ